MRVVECRRCGSHKAQGDACSACGAGLKQQTLRVKTRNVLAVTKEHYSHGVQNVTRRQAIGGTI